ncbi:MAG: hypothetical protein M1831_001497 [Alyxoria varia]|nr:MAG: hypothetical protein M1831_001497 [Alyxoria varia]
MTSPPNPILYANSTHTVYLLDIPTSISSAQYPSDRQQNENEHRTPCALQLLSTPPLQNRHPSTEPRTPRGRETVKKRMRLLEEDAALNEELATLAEDALKEVRRAVDGDREEGAGSGSEVQSSAGEAQVEGTDGGKFCLPRFVDEERWNRKRKREHEAGEDEHGDNNEAGIDRLLEKLSSAGLEDDTYDTSITWKSRGDILSPAANTSHGSNGSIACTGFLANPANERRTLTISQGPDGSNERPYPETPISHDLYVPPRSAFLLTHLTNSNLSTLATASSRYLRALESPRPSPAPPNPSGPQFDLLLLDPPWPNRSSRRRKPYSTTHHTPYTSFTSTSHPAPSSDLPTLLTLLRSLPIQSEYIAIWLTNSPAIRRAVLGPGGLFEDWGVEFVEEWVWVKITADGKPVGEGGFRGLWRKGWECLVIGRRMDGTVDGGGGGALGESVDVKVEEDKDQKRPKRRVVLAVPDTHSRKPCLKSLFEDLLLHPMVHAQVRADSHVKTEVQLQQEQEKSPATAPDTEPFAVCEVFARHLTSGWFSVGDECLKDMWVYRWRER